MTIEDKKQEIKKYYDDSNFKLFFTNDCENIVKIDFENEIVFYFTSVTASCGCCSEIEDCETGLNHFLEYLSDSDYEMFLNELKKAFCKINANNIK